MPGKKERVRNHGWNHCARNDCAHDVGVLRLRDDLMIETEQCRDGPEVRPVDIISV